MTVFYIIGILLMVSCVEEIMHQIKLFRKLKQNDTKITEPKKINHDSLVETETYKVGDSE